MYIKQLGVTAILPGRLRLHVAKNGFTVFIPTRLYSVSKQDGVVLHGFWDEAFKNTFYVFDLKRIQKGKCHGESGNLVFERKSDIERPEDRTTYQECDEGWFHHQQNNPRLAKAYQALNEATKLEADDAFYLEAVCCYHWIDHFFDCWEVSEKLGVPRLFACSFHSERVEWHYLVKGDPNGKPDPSLIQNYIEDCLKTQETLVFVHFLDETDPLCHAQAEFINMMALYLQQDFETLKIRIISVILRNKNNVEAYQAPFREYFSTNMLGAAGKSVKGSPTPFVMVFGHPSKNAQAKQTFYTRSQKTRLFDFDLFLGCRELLEEQRSCNFPASDRYKLNLRRALHETYRFAGMIVNKVYTGSRDYRRMSPEYVENALWRIERSGMIIKVHTEENFVARTAIRLACHLRSSGCPYVTVVLCDGPGDILEVHDNTDIYSEFTLKDGRFTDANDGDDLFWAVEQVVRRKYAAHNLNGASPLLLRPETEQRPSQKDRIPDIFRDLKKPLH